ncbi:MAG: hypothetical protein Q8R16_02135 [bacterium]|nr:hypothetical protein [bacterium]
MADTRRTTHDVRPAIEQALGDGTAPGDAETQFRDDGQLATFLSESDFTLFHDLYRCVAGLCFTVMDGSSGGVRGSLVPFMDAVTDIGRTIADGRMTAQELEQSRATLAEARTKLEDALTEARRDADRRVEDERAESGANIARLERRIIELETFAATGADAMVQRLTASTRQLVAEQRGVVTRISRCQAAFERLQQNDVDALPSIERIRVDIVGEDGRRQTVERTLDAEVAALSVDVARFHRDNLFLSEEERAALAAVLLRYDAIATLLTDLGGLLTMLEGELRGADGRAGLEEMLMACVRDWTTCGKKLESATAIFPTLFGRDVFVLAGTSADEVKRQEAAYGIARDVCRTASGEITQRIARYRRRYDAINGALAPIHERMAELRQYSDLAWLDALQTEDREAVRAAVLAYRDDSKIGAKTLIGVLAAAGVLPAVDEAAMLERLERILRPEFFAPAETNERMQRLMRTFTLTARARHWRDIWRRQDTALNERVRGGWTAWERAQEDEQHQRQQRNVDRVAAAEARRAAQEATQQEREAAAAAARAERARPTSIISRLEPLERSVLSVLAALLPKLRPEPNQEYLVKCVAAAGIAGIVPMTQPATTARALRTICTFDPPLLHLVRGTDGNERFALTSAGHRAVTLLPSLPSDWIRTAEPLVGYAVKNWQTTADVRCYHATLEQSERCGLPFPIPQASPGDDEPRKSPPA